VNNGLDGAVFALHKVGKDIGDFKHAAGEREMKHKLLVLVLIFCVACLFSCSTKKKHSSSRDSGGGGGGTGTNTGYDPGSNVADAAQYEQDVFDMVNDERASAGASALAWCDGLHACAKAHSNDMCDRGFFAHTNPDGEDPSARGRLGHAGTYTFQSIVSSPYSWGIAENIAMGQTSPAQVMTGWMNSPGHRANILNSSYTHIGVGLCDGCGRHWTQNFGTR